MSRRWAETISLLANPGCVLVAVLLVGIAASSFSRTGLLGWLAGLALASGLGTLMLVVAWARGVILDADLATPVNLHERSQVLLALLALILLLLIGSFRAAQPQPLHALLVTILGIGLVVALITYQWKISLHMLAIATFVTAVLLIAGPHFWPVSILIPLVAWARLRLSRHTLMQLVGGFTVGVIVTMLVFWMYGLV